MFTKLVKEVSANKITDISGPPPLFSYNKPILSAGLKSPSTPPKSNSDFGEKNNNLRVLILKIDRMGGRKHFSHENASAFFTNLSPRRTESEVEKIIK